MNSWIENYYKLKLSNNESDDSKAEQLKRENLPKKIYRYRPITDIDSLDFRLNEIINGEVFLNSSAVMNDPYDSKWNLNKNPFEYQNYYNYNHPELLGKYCEFIRSILKALKKDKLFIENLNKILQPEFEIICRELNLEVERLFRFICFSSDYLNNPMWYHYASKYEGVCLEYSTENFNESVIKQLNPISYSNKYPDPIIDILEGNKNNYTFPLYHKHSDWSYEKEWRLVVPITQFEDNLDLNQIESIPTDGKIFNFYQPSKVILGAKIKELPEKMIINNCNNNNIKTEKLTFGLNNLKTQKL